ncbi:hypothetical protein AAFF_G00018330 [Aldrovandia affinis]|uniref:Uncharacterized protein n=1 Tax=Aldrovandia affinis TaxID=143900 RepID=A0AAD7S5T6_9TELE|nr:hypothetical protein AAFF_G00018330 [Aldrovandia affinis]
MNPRKETEAIRMFTVSVDSLMRPEPSGRPSRAVTPQDCERTRTVPATVPIPLAGARKLALSTSMGSSALPRRLGN